MGKQHETKPHSNPLKLFETFSEKASYFIYLSAKVLSTIIKDYFYISHLRRYHHFYVVVTRATRRLACVGSVSAGGLLLRVCDGLTKEGGRNIFSGGGGLKIT